MGRAANRKWLKRAEKYQRANDAERGRLLRLFWWHRVFWGWSA
jgi:hypothetical protein